MSDNKSLMLIVSESNALEQMLIESGGALTPEIEQALAVSAEQLSDKADAYNSIMERFKGLSAHYEARAEFYDKISVQCNSVVERLRKNILFAMKALNTSEITGQDVRFTATKSSGSLKITDKEMVPVEFKEEIVSTEIKTDELKSAIKSGQNVPGAEVVYSDSLRIYANIPDKKTKAVKNV